MIAKDIITKDIITPNFGTTHITCLPVYSSEDTTLFTIMTGDNIIVDY